MLKTFDHLRALGKRLVGRAGPDDTAYCRGEFDPKASVQDIYHCFRLILGRRPTPPEWPGHSSRAGEDLASVVSSYVNSREFAHRGLIGCDYINRIEYVAKAGFGIHVSADDLAVGRTLISGDYEPQVAEVFRRRLSKGGGVIDIGANVGYFSLLSASLVGETGYVLSVEPSAGNARLLEASRRRNGFPQMRILMAAAAAELGLLAYNSSHSNGVAGSIDAGFDDLMSATLVPSLPVDMIVPRDRRIDLVKADVEGGEYLALLGLRATIERCLPTVVFEFSPEALESISGGHWSAIFGFLAQFGYRFAEITANAEPAWTDDPEVLAGRYRASGVDHIDVLAEVPR